MAGQQYRYCPIGQARHERSEPCERRQFASLLVGSVDGIIVTQVRTIQVLFRFIFIVEA